MELRTDCPLCKDLHHNCFVEQTTIEEKPFESSGNDVLGGGMRLGAFEPK